MKAIIEENNGLYIIRISGNEGLCDVFVVEEIELKEDSECKILKEHPYDRLKVETMPAGMQR